MTTIKNHPLLEPYLRFNRNEKVPCPFCAKPMEQAYVNSSMGYYEKLNCRCNRLNIESEIDKDDIYDLTMVLDSEIPNWYVEFNYTKNTLVVEIPATEEEILCCSMPEINPFDIPLLIKKIKLYMTFS